MSLSFKKKKEDFKCKNCGVFVAGTGYTNHCPKCLYSVHIDIMPGDRANDCKGMMIPVGVVKKKGEFFVVHKCEKCGEIKHNRAAENDDPQKIIEISILPV